jgi:hypothetical protein
MVIVDKKILSTPSAHNSGVIREIKTKMCVRKEKDFHSIPVQLKPEL